MRLEPIGHEKYFSVKKSATLFHLYEVAVQSLPFAESPSDKEYLNEIIQLIDCLGADATPHPDLIEELHRLDQYVFVLNRIGSLIHDELMIYFLHMILFSDVENELRLTKSLRSHCLDEIERRIFNTLDSHSLKKIQEGMRRVVDRYIGLMTECDNSLESFLSGYQNYIPLEYQRLIDIAGKRIQFLSTDAILASSCESLDREARLYRLLLRESKDEEEMYQHDIAFLEAASRLLCPCDTSGQVKPMMLNTFPHRVLQRQLATLFEKYHGSQAGTTLHEIVGIVFDLIDYPGRCSVLYTTGNWLQAPRKRSDKEVHRKLSDQIHLVHLCIQDKLNQLQAGISKRCHKQCDVP